MNARAHNKFDSFRWQANPISVQATVLRYHIGPKLTILPFVDLNNTHTYIHNAAHDPTEEGHNYGVIFKSSPRYYCSLHS